jgi:hypothetical protein
MPPLSLLLASACEFVESHALGSIASLIDSGAQPLVFGAYGSAVTSERIAILDPAH